MHSKSAVTLKYSMWTFCIYGAANAELITVQCFLDRCEKRKYTSQEIDLREMMKDQDKKIYLKFKAWRPIHCSGCCQRKKKLNTSLEMYLRVSRI